MVLAVGTTPPASWDSVNAGRGPGTRRSALQASEGLGELMQVIGKYEGERASVWWGLGRTYRNT